MKSFGIPWLPQARQQIRRRLFLRPARITPLHALNLTALYPAAWRQARGTRRLQLAGGLMVAGLLLTQVPMAPTALWRASADPVPMQSSLWESTGIVRQSVVDLHRARRMFIQESMATARPAPAETEGSAPPTVPLAAPVGDSPPPPPVAAAPSATPVTARTVAQPPVAPPAAAPGAFDPAKTIDTNLEMRVAVARNVSSLEVATSKDGYLMDLNGQNFCNLPAQTSVVLRPQGGGLGHSGCQLTNTLWLEPGEGGYVYVGNTWFKGRVLLMGSGSTLTAVNFVLMHDYLSSVVGSEMFVNWPIEALKAQAIAARSYALVHHVRHANRPYDLDNTQRYQAYLGIAKETNTTQTAVAATTGEFISYNGGIVESLYAASDAIVQAAHGGRGMSQTGAMELARQGYSYQEILGRYYPNTSLSRLVVH